eukprot:15035155-Alexandrium_andersonii.AAC.1
MRGECPADVVPVPAPAASTEAERALHELTHTPPADWCEACQMGGGAERPHYRHEVSEPRHIPL